MNKVILMGRLTKDPEMRYSQGAEPMAIARYTLAVNRGYKREGEPEADFINVVAFGKRGEFAEKYFQKGQQVAVVGHLQVNSYDDKEGVKRWSTDVIVDEQHFAESKKSFEERGKFEGQARSSYPETPQPVKSAEGFVPISQEFDDDDDLPF
ncbi:MAG: single-stranded DNA-binding protein [Firmicutes bacterium HGW-Firmicutes-1]|jgi:single-strand DNA-binding protein|nr:MAG: single-stranded DNA-binding protein [Firmicutes bacterium HGW-Firmicutes-1]